MKIIIKETQKIETLSFIDPNTGVDCIADFVVGNTGALIDGQFEWDEDHDAYVCSQDTFNWWDEVVASNQELVNRTHELVKEHGSEAVYNAIHEAGSVYLEEYAANANKALDEAFGSAE